jgi:hypothetical protein
MGGVCWRLSAGPCARDGPAGYCDRVPQRTSHMLGRTALSSPHYPPDIARSRWHRDKPQFTYLCNFSVTLVGDLPYAYKVEE